MTTRYVIETWNPLLSKYVTAWSGSDYIIAKRMMNKPYMIRFTRRLLETTEKELSNQKAGEYD
jgi:hypothetical protein